MASGALTRVQPAGMLQAVFQAATPPPQAWLLTVVPNTPETAGRRPGIGIGHEWATWVRRASPGTRDRRFATGPALSIRLRCYTPGCHTPGCHTPGCHTPGCHTPGCHTPGSHTPGSHTPDPISQRLRFGPNSCFYCSSRFPRVTCLRHVGRRLHSASAHRETCTSQRRFCMCGVPARSRMFAT